MSKTNKIHDEVDIPSDLQKILVTHIARRFNF